LTQSESTLLNTGADIGVGAAAYYAGSVAASGSVLLAAQATRFAVDTYWSEKQNALDVHMFEKDVNAGRVNAATGRFFQEEERRYWKPRGLESVAAAKELSSFKGVGIHRFDDEKLTKAMDYVLPKEFNGGLSPVTDISEMRRKRDVQIASLIKNLRVNISKTLAEERRNPTTLEQYTGPQGEIVAGYRYNEEKALANAYENFYKGNRNNLGGLTLGDFTTMMTDSMTRETKDGRKQIGYRFNPKGEMWTRPADYRGNMRAPASWDYIWPIEENKQNTPSGFDQPNQISEVNKPLDSTTAPGVVSDRQLHTLRNGYGVARTDDDK
jgi:hypothetical protein